MVYVDHPTAEVVTGKEALRSYFLKEQPEQGARLDSTDGRCTHFREYWFDVEGHAGAPYEGWGR